MRPLMYTQRLRTMLIEVYKVIYKLGPQYLHDLIEMKEHAYGMRNVKTVVQPKCKSTKYGIQSFRYQGAKLWNELDNNMNNFISDLSP